MNIDLQKYSELKSLVDAMCDNAITDEQATRLEQLIASDEEAMEFYIQYMWMSDDLERVSSECSPKIDISTFDGLLPEAEFILKQLTPTEENDMVSSVPSQKIWNAEPRELTSTRRSWGRLMLQLVTLFAGVALFGWALTSLDMFSEREPAVVVAQEVTAENLLRKTLEDGTVVIARPATRFIIEERRQIRLEHGELYLVVAKSDVPFVVLTPDGEVRATGTRFNVSANGKTETAVAQGRVVLVSKQGSVPIGAGQQGTLIKDVKPTRGPAKRLSYLVNWARDALKQDEPLVTPSDKENGLITIDPYGQEARLSLRKYHVDVHIEDGVARTTIDQTFFNHQPWNTEGTFYFPLPPDASVSRLAMYVNGELNEGGMVSRERGQEIYTDILYQRRDPALLEMMEGNTFKMRIFPLEGRQEKRIFLSYTQTLEELYGSSKYWFPMDHTQDIANEVSIRIRIRNGAQTFDPQSSTHKLETQVDGNDLVMNYSAAKTKPDQDLLLNLIPKPSTRGPADEASVAVCELNGQHFISARFRPELTGSREPEPRQWVVLNDVSASRSNLDLKTQRYILQRLIAEADDEDSVFLIDLNTAARKISKQPVNVRSAAVNALLDHRPDRLIGATNVESGLKAAREVIDSFKLKNPFLVYLGDGVATDGETSISELPRLISTNCRFVGVGVGKRVDTLFLQEAANRTGGVLTTINPNEDIDWRVFDLLALLNTPRLTKIQIDLLDEHNQSMESIAYPSSQLLAAGETLTVTAMCGNTLPARIRFQGRIGEATFTRIASVANAKQGADYLPRLWAKRHIDELLKSNMSSKDEIVALSKDFYLVTPYTSLIVLEDDAMYEEYGVERGRKDHWAKYAAPQTIDIVREPVENWNRWGWTGWRNLQSEESRIDVNTHPQTVQEIVDNIQIRVNAPLYLWQESARDSRADLYRLCDREIDPESDPTQLLTLWFLLAAGEREALARWQTEMHSGPQETGIRGQGATRIRNEAVLRNIRAILPGRMPFDMAEALGRRGFGGGRERFDLDPARFRLANEGAGSASMLRFQLEGGPAATAYFRLPKLIGLERSLQNQMHGARGMVGLMPQEGWYDALGPQLSRTFNQAITTRQNRLTRDIQKYNHRNGHWGQGQWDLWNSIDLRRNRSSDAIGVELVDILASSFGDKLEFGRDRFLVAADMPVDFGRLLPRSLDFAPISHARQQFQGARIDNGQSRAGAPYFYPLFMDSERPGLVASMKRIRAGSFFAISQQPATTQPGLSAILAADHLVRRLAELEQTQPEDQVLAEKTAIETALSKMDRVGANLEPNELFWGHAGWQYQPRPQAIQPPTIQAYQGYRWSFDLTRYASGLYSDTWDMLDEVMKQYRTDTPTGKIDAATRELIASARSRFKPVQVKHNQNGPKILVGPNDQFAMSRRSEMYLTERLICDGSSIYQVYDEIGIAAQRHASEVRVSALRQLVPHALEPAEVLAKYFDVELVDNNAEFFSLKLIPVQVSLPTTEADATDDGDQFNGVADKLDSYLLIQVDHEGRTHQRQLIHEGVAELTISFEYTDEDVSLNWHLKGKSEPSKGFLSYSVKPLDENTEAFTVNEDPLVVFAMPLKKPSYYLQELQQLANRRRNAEGQKTADADDQQLDLAKMDFLDDDVPAAIRLSRHLLLAKLQDFNLPGWEYANPGEANEFMTRILDLQKRIGVAAKQGDLVLLGSRGGSLRAVSGFPEDWNDSILRHFFELKGSWVETEQKLGGESGLIGHLASYRVAAMSERRQDYQAFRKRFEDSPLTLALVCNSDTSFRHQSLVELNEDPRWAGTALLMAAFQSTDDSDKHRVAEAFWKWEQALASQNKIPALAGQVVELVRSVDANRLTGVLAKQLKQVRESEDVSFLLTFAEQLSAWGETELANTAYADAADRLEMDTVTNESPLLKRFAFAQSLWAGNRYKPALKEYQKIRAYLSSKNIPLSPAFLAATARLANQAGNLEMAIELEEEALALEQPFLPDAINLAAFRQRYQWLWNCYLERVQRVSEDDPNRGEKIELILQRATATWDRWIEVDRDNVSLPGQMATLLNQAGRTDQSWEFLSSVIDKRPRDANSYYIVGEWFRQQGDKAATAKWLGEAPQWDTANPQWIYHYGKALKELGRNREANVQFNKVIGGKWAPGLQTWIDQAKAEIQ